LSFFGHRDNGLSTENTVALFPGHTHKPMLALKGRKSDDITTIQKQLQAPFSKLRTQNLNIFNNGANAGITV
jgi:hypothetical protein